MLVALASALGVDVPSPHDLMQAARNARAPEGQSAPPSATRGPHGGKLRVAIAQDIFAGGGTVAYDERIAELRPKAVAMVSPRTARSLEVEQGDVVDLTGGSATLAGLEVRVVSQADDNAITIIDAVPAAPANVFADGQEVRVQNVRSSRAALAAGVA